MLMMRKKKMMMMSFSIKGRSSTDIVGKGKLVGYVEAYAYVLWRHRRGACAENASVT